MGRHWRIYIMGKVMWAGQLAAHAELHCFYFDSIPGITWVMLVNQALLPLILHNTDKLGELTWGWGYVPHSLASKTK